MKLPLLSAKELCVFLEKEGFVNIRQKGSHRFYKHLDGRFTIVPIHSNTKIGRGLLAEIIEQIELTKEEFIKKY
ncbi:MAG: type II toxin-antitoxin system HicA family toxin [Candidatus Nanoarchaeia archaeon]|nr:type II toxin-antitoxin system HicA family toxin [Candidatus Nanoarchaeia archaeon]